MILNFTLMGAQSSVELHRVITTAGPWILHSISSSSRGNGFVWSDSRVQSERKSVCFLGSGPRVWLRYTYSVRPRTGKYRWTR